MRLGVVSDTHGHLDYTQEGLGALARRGVDIVIHCGDIGSSAIVSLFDRWPTHFVFGNVDHDTRRLRADIEKAGHTCHGTFGELELEGVKVAFLHGDDRELLRTTVESGRFALVCHGHTHIAGSRREGKTTVLNPGALFRANPHSVATVDMPSLTIEHIWL